MDDKTEMKSELISNGTLTAPGRFEPVEFENLVAIVGLLIIAGLYAWHSPAEAIKIVTPIALMRPNHIIIGFRAGTISPGRWMISRHAIFCSPG